MAPFVADIGIIALNGMIDDILSLEEPSFKDLVEARIFIELKGSSWRHSEDPHRIFLIWKMP